jgi:hypothetical protein
MGITNKTDDLNVEKSDELGQAKLPFHQLLG